MREQLAALVAEIAGRRGQGADEWAEAYTSGELSVASKVNAILQEPCGVCITAGPDVQGPSEECPQHGRPYSYWVEHANRDWWDNPEAQEWLDSLDALLKIEEGEEARYGNPDGAYESILIDMVAGRMRETTALKDALTILVNLKDGPRDENYLAAKESAWAVARELVAE